MPGQKGFFFDQSRCSGCFTCILACKQWHSVEHEARNWRRVETIEGGIYPHLQVSFLSLSCCHCEVPLCADACPASAITKRDEDGIVLVDPNRCLGQESCGVCKESCPYGVPEFGNGVGRKMEKCDFCFERLEEGKNPICVDACPMRALDAGLFAELLGRYGPQRDAEGFKHSTEARPSIVMRRK